MSGEATLWAARQDITNHAAKLTLIALCDAFDDRTGACFPSHEHICEFVRRSETQIKEALRWLEAEGWIKRETRFAETKRQKSNNYQIMFDRGESFKDMLARRGKMRGDNEGGGGEKAGGGKPPKIGGGIPPGVGAENRPLEGAESRHPLTESLLNNGAQARDFENDGGKEGEEDKKWRGRLELYRENGKWPPFNRWGPKMGEPGCLVPAHLVKLWNETEGAHFKPKTGRKPKPDGDGKAWARKANGLASIGEATRRLNLPGTSHD